MAVTTGRKIGVVIKINAAISMMLPSNSKQTLIINRITMGLALMASMPSVSNSGRRYMASSQAKAVAVPTSRNTTDVVRTLAFTAIRKSGQERLR